MNDEAVLSDVETLVSDDELTIIEDKNIEIPPPYNKT